MIKNLTITALLSLVLTGCGGNQTGVLDTSKLEKVEYEHLTKEGEKKLPILYDAPSLKVGRNALPYEMKLPKKFPFKVYRYAFNIRDLKHDGKHLRATFVADVKDENAKFQFKIEASHPIEKNNLINVTEIKLDDKVRGEYKGNTLYFQLKGVSYKIIYWNEEISKEQQQKEIIDMANEIIYN
ncbi:hypothetical protein QNH39_26035 [Neobacillus novalis]|uniref:Lipoprotein n=1 Tax=Neobacillus novalis TaxID=220687 RepID=A0AA95MLP4_9BACI|nr:hypothetical protein [Neobacillus novalis]WHY85996.1 hypothetical protein QNH39_26035 [Neobacillus novalis]